jgi:hypothetical protein
LTAEIFGVVTALKWALAFLRSPLLRGDVINLHLSQLPSHFKISDVNTVHLFHLHLLAFSQCPHEHDVLHWVGASISALVLDPSAHLLAYPHFFKLWSHSWLTLTNANYFHILTGHSQLWHGGTQSLAWHDALFLDPSLLINC